MRGQTGMRLLFAIAFILAPMLAATANAVDDHVNASLLSEQTALVPGTTMWLGVRLEHAPHWHTYWINPGDSGLPTRLTWQLPPGFRAGEVAWPAPARIAVGDLYNFGYEGDRVLPIPIEVPADAPLGGTAHLAVAMKWLACREECIPGNASLAIDLPVREYAARDPEHAQRIDAARAAQPRPAPASGRAQVLGDRVEVTLRGDHLPALTDAFVVQRKVANYAPPQIARIGNEVVVAFAKSDYFDVAPAQIDLVLRADSQVWSVSAPVSSP